MFIIELTYKVDLEKVNAALPDHLDYLKKQYDEGAFVCSGRKEPRTGGILLSKLPSKEAVLKTIHKDPFKQQDLADYRIIEFVPTMTSQAFAIIKE